MNKILKIFVFIILNLNFYNLAISKPLPPGSGSGDVPANILILLDSSLSMNNKLGDGLPDVAASTIDTRNGNKIISSAKKNKGGLFLYNSAGEQIDFQGTKRSDGSSYTVEKWKPENNTDTKCDYHIKGDTIEENKPLKKSEKIHNVMFKDNFTFKNKNGTTLIDSEPLIFYLQWDSNEGRVIALNADTLQCRLSIGGDKLKKLYSFDFSTTKKGDEFISIMASGGMKKKANESGTLLTCNFAKGKCVQQSGRKNSGLYRELNKGRRMVIDSAADYIYFLQGGDIYRYNLTETDFPIVVGSGMTIAPESSCVTHKGADISNRVMYATDIDVSSTDDSIFFISSSKYFRVQKIQYAPSACTLLTALGKESLSENLESAGTLAADDVRISAGGYGIEVIDNKVLLAHGAFVDEFSETLFTSANIDTAWRNQVGGGKETRWSGAKKAIATILSDTTLTQGAHFGFGYWNAGAGGVTGKSCDKGGTDCNYYQGWNGSHPDGQSVECTMDSCLKVGISAEGASKIIPQLGLIQLRYGTDSHAWSKMASDYWNNDNTAFDPESTCQLNYVIVISDGRMRNHGIPKEIYDHDNNHLGKTSDTIVALRENLGVKTLMVAYGDGITDMGQTIFDELAWKGSCDQKGDADCEPTIVAKTGVQLKTQLAQKIRQILAKKLAFTAPSITATVQEGGSIYQAQFEYQQDREWQGTLTRLSVGGEDDDYNVDFSTSEENEENWDAAKMILEQTSEKFSTLTLDGEDDDRKIWTVFPNSNYIGSWDNVKKENFAEIKNLMTRLGYQIVDYHNSSSTCSTVGVNGTDDEVIGLINFINGSDYFDYNGDCVITERRDHILGDIYHSQPIEIGPPNATLAYRSNNEEAYFRAINNYAGFKNSQANRDSIIYAGSNSGLLHAICAKDNSYCEGGEEAWAFLPPFVAGKLPLLINKDLDGNSGKNKNSGGSNAIFGVDGSPVVQDVFIRGLKPDGEIEDDPSWHTILIVPYGRGGSGFSVLDVTNPYITGDVGPLHMFSVYNDYINNSIYVINKDGVLVQDIEYTSFDVNIADSREAARADSNYEDAETEDGGEDSQTFTRRDQIGDCTAWDHETNGEFYNSGTSSCYQGRKFTFEDVSFPGVEDNTPLPSDTILVSQFVDGINEPLKYDDARVIDGNLILTLPNVEGTTYQYNRGQKTGQPSTTPISVSRSCAAQVMASTEYDYSKLGETWSTPRIARLPSPDLTSEETDFSTDKYVAIMGGGIANNRLCAGSAVYLVELDNMEEPGKIFGHEQNAGPIKIIDTSPEGANLGNDIVTTENGSDIANAVPTAPVVITPDTAFGLTWRGAMVYINDREGKITKINLTDMGGVDKNGATVRMFDQTTLFTLNANQDNKRYTFFPMDAGIGGATKQFYLFGGTGNFNALSERSAAMDNILYAIRDVDYPNFTHLNDVVIPLGSEDGFLKQAHIGADNARTIDDDGVRNSDATQVCIDVTGDTTGDLCPEGEDAWAIHLDRFRKASAPPTLFKGKVYYPVYEPPQINKCAIGNAFICVADDECGTNNTSQIATSADGEVVGSDCLFVREGVLSELVIFGDKLFANVAGPKDSQDTLYSVLSAPGEVLSNQGNWRDTGF